MHHFFTKFIILPFVIIKTLIELLLRKRITSSSFGMKMARISKLLLIFLVLSVCLSVSLGNLENDGKEKSLRRVARSAYYANNWNYWNRGYPPYERRVIRSPYPQYYPSSNDNRKEPEEKRRTHYTHGNSRRRRRRRERRG
ncbi:UNVERIFIED_CONTAM: hypothetical protein RMT77_005844 [Armadillidium vulgare]